MARRKGARQRRTRIDASSPGLLDLDFTKSPVVSDFLQDNKGFVRGILGPVGSGKSYACAAEILLRAAIQKPNPADNIRYSRFAIIRNSYPMLRTTTIKTWQDLFPEHLWGPMRWSPPITHHLQLPGKDDAPGIDAEVIFIALDKESDVRKLLSLEITGAWVNEARELPLGVIQGLTHRVGRYPSKAMGGCTWRGIWLDTNSMPDDHWWYRLSEKEPITGNYPWNFYRQKGAVQEVLPEEPNAIPGAGKYWKINSDAENFHNLPYGYYDQQVGGKNLDWIRCYLEAKFVYVQEGRPVWPEYDDDTMVSPIEPDPSLPLQIGLDFGLTPAACIGQKQPTGEWYVVGELVAFDMGLQRFANDLLTYCNRNFPKHDLEIFGDPAGVQRDQIYETTAFDHLRTIGLNAKPAPSNDFKVRREGGALPMTRLIKGKPGLQIHPTCTMTRKSLAGGYYFKRVPDSRGQELYRDEPYKNNHSHIGDAYGYLMTGGGEHRRMTRRLKVNRPTIAKMDFDVFN